MATSSGLIKSSDGWVSLDTHNKSFVLETSDPGYDLFVFMSETEPAEGAHGHRVLNGKNFPLGTGHFGAAWIRTDAIEDIRYVLTTGTAG